MNCQSSHMSASNLRQLLRVVQSTDIQPPPAQQLLQVSGDIILILLQVSDDIILILLQVSGDYIQRTAGY